jgi:hypothetical protein
MRSFAGGQYVLVHTGEFAAPARLPGVRASWRRAANKIIAPEVKDFTRESSKAG